MVAEKNYTPGAIEQWVPFPFSFTDLQTAAVTNTINLYSLPANAIIRDAKIKVTTAFSGTTTITLSLGVSGTLAKFITAASAASTTVLSTVLTASDIESTSAATDIQLTAVSTINNLSSLTQGAGVVELCLAIMQ